MDTASTLVRIYLFICQPLPGTARRCDAASGSQLL